MCLLLSSRHSDQEQVRRVSDLYYKSGQIKDRRYHLATYKTCFVAREFVEWAVTGVSLFWQ